MNDAFEQQKQYTDKECIVDSFIQMNIRQMIHLNTIIILSIVCPVFSL